MTWIDTVETLVDLPAFRNACRAFCRGETTIGDSGPWPARFADPDVKWRTSLQPNDDVPESRKAYKQSLDDDETSELSKSLDVAASIDPMSSLVDMMDRRTGRSLSLF